ncbi:MAG: DUF362 domain-containing protein [Candidatus Woesearchaeota archaeon]
MTKVAIVKCADYALADAAVRKAVELIGGIDKFVKPGNRVLLKPNLLFGKEPASAVCTHPAIVGAVAKLVLDAGGIPFVGDSPGIGSGIKAMEIAGIKKVCDELKVKVIELDQPITIKNMKGKLEKSFQISKKVLDCDVIINLPKLKTHSLTQMTLAVKNMYGVIPGRIKASYHLRFADAVPFSEMLLDLSEIVKPHLNIIDGVVAMEGNGPGQGEPRKLGLVLASESCHALDAVVCKIVGLSERQLPTIALAKKRGIADIKKIETVGEEISAVQVHDFKKAPTSILSRLPKELKRRVKNILSGKPQVIPDLCIACGNCKKACPAHVIRMINNLPRIHYEKCIRCYCCAEVCPKKAMEIKDNLLSKAVKKVLS